MTNEDFLIVNLGDNNKLRYSKFVKGKIGYYDNIRISLDTNHGESYILDENNYYGVFGDLNTIITEYKDNEVFTFNDDEQWAFEKGLGYYQSLYFNEIKDNEKTILDILDRLEQTNAFLFGRQSVSDIMTNCFSFRNKFYIELSRMYIGDAPESEQEHKNFANWLKSEYRVLHRVKLRLDQLNDVENILQLEFNKLR